MFLCPWSQGWAGLGYVHRITDHLSELGETLATIIPNLLRFPQLRKLTHPEMLSDLPKVTQPVEGQD